MEWLATKGNTVFMGQSVLYPGTSMFETLKGVYPGRRIEWPVAEDMQLGVALGMSLSGNWVPVCIFPRFNFLLLAFNQLVNHLDRLPLYSDYRPKVIIRTAVGSSQPLDPGPQHQDDFTWPLSLMCKTVRVVRLGLAEDIMPEYQKAWHSDRSTVLVETGGA